ncbi:MAG: hypothetical protein ABI824_19285, partial [Acidobacteriota bacterium]
IQLFNLVTRSRRPQVLRLDNLLIAAVQAGAALMTILLFPDYLFVFRMAVATYHSFGKSLFEICVNPAGVFLVATTVASLTWGRRRTLAGFRNVMLVVAWSDTLVVIYQREGFAYHYYPLEVMILLMLTALLLDALQTTAAYQKVLAYAVLPLIGFVGIVQGTEVRAMPKQTGPLLPLVEREAKGKPVLVLSTSLWASSPLLSYAGATSAWRYRSLWNLGAFYPEQPAAYRTNAEMSEYERYLLDSLDEDMRRHPPQLIIVETGDDKEGFRGGRFDYLDYLRHDQRFARHMADYTELVDVTRYKVFRRR